MPEVVAGEPVRIQKLLSTHGRGSRREIDDLIAAGRVTVNGEVAELGARATAADRIEVDGKPIRLSASPVERVVLLYHKPAGEIVSQDDPEGRPTVFDSLPRPASGRWIPVGRLDYNTSGLLLLTTWGDLAARLMHPSHEVEREYAVRVLGELDPDQRMRLIQGVDLEDGLARFDQLEEAGGDGINRWYSVTLHEGRNREVRRMVEAVGLVVSRLIRTRFGPIGLPRDLPRGKAREATPAELRALAAVVGLDPEVTGAPAPAGRERPLTDGTDGVLEDVSPAGRPARTRPASAARPRGQAAAEGRGAMRSDRPVTDRAAPRKAARKSPGKPAGKSAARPAAAAPRAPRSPARKNPAGRPGGQRRGGSGR
jgi:23S rRNA pseudouridine2605 synthase